MICRPSNSPFCSTNASHRARSFADELTPPAGDYEDYVELWELWLPRDQLIVTFPAQSNGILDGRPLLVKPWVGPEGGPFHLLSFGDVPGNTMPTAPVHDMIDLHTSENALMNKLIRQAKRQKKNQLVPGVADKDAKRLVDAEDGEMIKADAPGQIQELASGGIDNLNFQFTIQLRQLYTYLQNNLDAIGGLAPQADTLGENKLLMGTASKTVEGMQEETMSFIESGLRSMCWYYWTDPLQTYKTQMPLPNCPFFGRFRRISIECFRVWQSSHNRRAKACEPVRTSILATPNLGPLSGDDRPASTRFQSGWR